MLKTPQPIVTTAPSPRSFALSHGARILVGVAIGSVWVFHGLYSKILGGIARHELIVARILGADNARTATLVIGTLEVLLGVWAASGRARRSCALTQTVAIVAMNALEVVMAKDLLISAPGMLILNGAFLSVVWVWAISSVRVSSNVGDRRNLWRGSSRNDQEHSNP